jgi:hypothetical protein
MRKRWLAALVIAGVLAGCAKHRLTDDDMASDASSTLHIVNHHWGDVDIYVNRDGQRTRVGQVTASAEENFVLSKSVTGGGGSTIQFQAHAVGSSGAISSESISVRPGGMQITWTLENNLSRATLAFY